MDQGDYYYYYNSSSSNLKKSGQIPVFGNWDFTNDLPITQYFECARQAGLGRYSSSSGESDPRSADLYKAPPRGTAAAVNALASLKTKANEKRGKRSTLVNDEKDAENKLGRIYDVTQPPPKVRHLSHSHHTNRRRSELQSDVVSYPRPRLANNPPKSKAVDEDLYKIPPEQLFNNRKKKLGFISRCLVPACSA